MPLKCKLYATLVPNLMAKLNLISCCNFWQDACFGIRLIATCPITYFL